MERAANIPLERVDADAGGIKDPDVEQAGGVGAGDDEVLARGRHARAVPPGQQLKGFASCPTEEFQGEGGIRGETGDVPLDGRLRAERAGTLDRRSRLGVIAAID